MPRDAPATESASPADDGHGFKHRHRPSSGRLFRGDATPSPRSIGGSRLRRRPALRSDQRMIDRPVGLSVETSSRCARPGRRTEVDQPEMVVEDSDPTLIDGDPLEGNSLAAQRAVGCRARVACTGTGCPARTRTRAGRVRAACDAMPRSTHGGSPRASCRRRCCVRRIPSRPCPSLPGPLAVEADADDSCQRTAHPACVSPPGLRSSVQRTDAQRCGHPDSPDGCTVRRS